MNLDTLLVSAVHPTIMHICDQKVYRPYGIYDHLGQRLFLCGEANRSNCSGQNRPFKIIIFNSYGQSLIVLERSCNCCLCSCGSHVLGSEVKVSSALTNQHFGTVSQTCSLFTPKFEVLDNSGDFLLSIEGTTCASLCSTCCLGPGACCFHSDFDVMYWKDQHKYQVGFISKKISCSGIYDDSSNFTWLGSTFLPNLDSSVKLLLLATLFSIEISYYETTCSRRFTTQQLRTGSCCNKLDYCCVQSCICIMFYVALIIAIVLITLQFGYGFLYS
ncbi:unnamed protein product [Allacma fusca]|nr:unnamed protein product [Allacma fusca]